MSSYLTGKAALHLLEAYILPKANNQPRNECLSAASHVVQIHTHARFPQSKKWPTYKYAI